jgi:hypothetical protein
MAHVDISVIQDDRLLSEDMRRLLEGILTKITCAKSGDILAVVCSLSYNRTASASSVSQYLVKGDTSYGYETYSGLLHEKQGRVAHVSMMLNERYIGWIGTRLEDALDQMSPGDGQTFYATAIIFPEKVVLLSDEADDFIENVVDTVDQIDGTTGNRIMQIFKAPPQSNHAALQSQPDIEGFENFINDWQDFEIYDSDGDTVPLKLKLVEHK